jgi:thioredoxin 1
MELLHFTADWCQPCKQMEPVIAMFLSENLNVNYEKIDVTDSLDQASEHKVQGIPTFIALIDGKEVARHTGVATKESLLGLFT